MDIFKKNRSIKGVLEKLLKLPNPISENTEPKREEEREFGNSRMPKLIRIKMIESNPSCNVGTDALKQLNLLI